MGAVFVWLNKMSLRENGGFLHLENYPEYPLSDK